MGERIRKRGTEAVERWHRKMPRFFYWMVVAACGIGGTAFAINSGLPMLGGTHAEWWDEAYRYIVSTCIGVVFACKFTVAGGYKDIDPDSLGKGRSPLPEKPGEHTVLDRDIDTLDDEE